MLVSNQTWQVFAYTESLSYILITDGNLKALHCILYAKRLEITIFVCGVYSYQSKQNYDVPSVY